MHFTAGLPFLSLQILSSKHISNTPTLKRVNPHKRL
ncbi:hypothetical protein BVRB_2g046930 [Beta vulgaris subsp. vulgaris]|nr:hypothetical protein BVRB_2g046930 [Beta vulgaris subsp. vulgaris]